MAPYEDSRCPSERRKAKDERRKISFAIAYRLSPVDYRLSIWNPESRTSNLILIFHIHILIMTR